MSDVFERANAGDTEALREILRSLYDQDSEELFSWTEKALKAAPDDPAFLNYMGICYADYVYGVGHDEQKAVEYYKRAAELGNEKAARNLAVKFYGDKDPQAFEWAQKAYELGDEEGAGLIAVMYNEGLGVPVDRQEAFRWNLKGAESGDGNAQRAVALNYLYGEGCTANVKEAVDWLRTAAECGNGLAAEHLSVLYRTGEFLPVDMEEAIHYAIMAAESEPPELDSLYEIADMYRMGNQVGKNPQKALELYTIVADHGNVSCMENVGILYTYEEHGIPRNVDKAIEYFERAASHGSEKAFVNLKQLYKEKYAEKSEEHYFSNICKWSESEDAGVLTELGILYCNGTGVEKDEEKGKAFIKKAANKGNKRALSIVSAEYLKEGNPEAEKYLNRSLQAGNAEAKALLGKLYTSGGAYADKEREGIRLLKEAAEKDKNPEAMFALARFEENDAKKKDWWEKAAELGHREALYLLTDLHYTLGEFEEAEKWAKLGIAQGIIGCANRYADMLCYKKIGIESEQNMAYTYFEKTAEAGNVYGCRRLGKCYLFGDGGATEDIGKAIEWLTKGLELSGGEDADLLIFLGVAYSKDGATKDVSLAVKYLKQGLDACDEAEKKAPAYAAAANILFDMYREANLEGLAYQLVKQLVDDGVEDCKMNLAFCYIDGIGISEDRGRAKTLIEETLKRDDLTDDERVAAQEILSDLLKGNYGTDSSIQGTVNGGTIHQTSNSVTYRPDNQKQSKGGGCYIATCVYGSYDCPNVWVLRRYRDEKLAKNFFGKIFIKFYYAISPSVVKVFGNQKWFKSIWLGILNPFVEKLKRDGFSDQRYYDK